MMFDEKILLVLFVLLQITFYLQGQDEISQKNSNGGKSGGGPIPIIIKDAGVDDLKKGDVAMIFYITVTNIGFEPVRLFINNTKCCQQITNNDEDCESMQLFGVDVGELYPQDTRNLTLLYPNLYLHNRVGRCDMEIMDAKNRKMTRKVEFDTTLIKLGGLIPRLLQNYYNPREMIDCKSTDEDPLNACQPYPCLVRYDGTRNMYNHTTKRCEQIPKCIPETEKDLIDEAYIIETNSCKTLIRSMTEQEFTQFGEGKPSIRVLSRAHGYPLNVRCHNGHRSDTNRWCECKPGWDSAPFDHKNFNPDLQVYHMCTVWTGEMTAEQARNITFRQKHEHGITPILVYSFLFFGGLVSFVIVGIIIFRYLKRRRRPGASDALDESETVGLQETSPESESELEP